MYKYQFCEARSPAAKLFRKGIRFLWRAFGTEVHKVMMEEQACYLKDSVPRRQANGLRCKQDVLFLSLIIEDYQAGDMNCPEGRLNVGEHFVDVRSEWQSFRNEKSCVGVPKSLL
uniref:Uncharacterized protein n=1 Tax=Glossina austeni TaxID=7395 RepID=A0A1A9UNQ4_GLOAU